MEFKMETAGNSEYTGAYRGDRKCCMGLNTLFLGNHGAAVY